MYAVFDIGGTYTRIASSTDGKTFAGPPLILNTPKNWPEAKQMLQDQFSRYKGVKSCGGIPGVFDKEKETLTWSPNLPDWVGKPVKQTIQEATGAPVLLYNDAVVDGVGEATVGAGKGKHIVAYLTVSTGVGGARIIDGKPDEYSSGFEPGQQILNIDSHTTLERLVSGTAFARRYGLDFVESAPSEAWTESASTLAIGIYNTILHWSPDVVVLGGSMITKPRGIPLAFVQEKLLALPKVFSQYPELVIAKLGDLNGLFGALALIQ